jgi:hypothetical protein
MSTTTDDYVKGFFPGESMWVKVLSRTDDEIIGTLENTPAFDQLLNAKEKNLPIDEFYEAILQKGKQHDASYGDTVVLKREKNEDLNIFNWIYKGKAKVI